MNSATQPSSKRLYERFQRDLILGGTIELLEQMAITDPPEKRSVSCGLPRVSVTKIVKYTGVPRASFYRLYPDGFTSVRDSLAKNVLLEVQTIVERSLTTAANERAEITAQEGVHIGSRGLFEGISESDYFRRVLAPHDELMPEIARLKSSVGPLRALGRYVTRIVHETTEGGYDVGLVATEVDNFEKGILGAVIEGCFLQQGEEQIEALRIVSESDRALSAEQEFIDKVGLDGVVISLEQQAAQHDTIQYLSGSFADTD